MNAFVVVIDGHGKLFLGLVLADYVFVEKRLHFLGLGQVVGRGGGVSFRPVVFKDGIADRNALVTDVRPGVVTRGGNELGHSVLPFTAERTMQWFLRGTCLY